MGRPAFATGERLVESFHERMHLVHVNNVLQPIRHVKRIGLHYLFNILLYSFYFLRFHLYRLDLSAFPHL
jgi:hypothetical protein